MATAKERTTPDKNQYSLDGLTAILNNDNESFDERFKKLDRYFTISMIETVFTVWGENQIIDFDTSKVTGAIAQLHMLEVTDIIKNTDDITQGTKDRMIGYLIKNRWSNKLPSNDDFKEITQDNAQEILSITKIYYDTMTERYKNYAFIAQFGTYFSDLKETKRTLFQQNESNAWRLAYALQSVRMNEQAFIYDAPLTNKNDLLVNLTSEDIDGIISSMEAIKHMTASLYAFMDLIPIFSEYFAVPSLEYSEMYSSDQLFNPKDSLAINTLLDEVKYLIELLDDINTNAGPLKGSLAINNDMNKYEQLKKSITSLNVLKRINGASKDAFKEAQEYLELGIDIEHYEFDDFRKLFRGIENILKYDIVQSA